MQVPAYAGDQLRWIFMPAKAGICFSKARGFSPVKSFETVSKPLPEEEAAFSLCSFSFFNAGMVENRTVRVEDAQPFSLFSISGKNGL
jgi:hypothetical protein